MCTRSVWSIIHFCCRALRIEMLQFSFNTRKQVTQTKHLKWQQFWSNQFYCWFVSSLIKNKNTSTNMKWSIKHQSLTSESRLIWAILSPDGRFNKGLIKRSKHTLVIVWNTHFHVPSASYCTKTILNMVIKCDHY